MKVQAIRLLAPTIDRLHLQLPSGGHVSFRFRIWFMVVLCCVVL
jgi:hypothetical protein